MATSKQKSPMLLKKKPEEPSLPKSNLNLKLKPPLKKESLVTVHASFEDTDISESEKELDLLVSSLRLDLELETDKKKKDLITLSPFPISCTPPEFYSSKIDIDPSFFDCSWISDNDSPIPLTDFKDCTHSDTPSPLFDESLC